ncbi:MAG: bifunctional 2-methylcitrate dehydratase/aconitate hydratase [Pirellulales bacterium]
MADQLLEQLADYALGSQTFNATATETARLCLMDSIGCGLMALQYPACTKLLGPFVPGIEFAGGVPIPGTAHRLDPIAGAFNLGTMIRWLDFNDTWLAAEWGHPSDNLGAILAVADYRQRVLKRPTTVSMVLDAMIRAHEIQGVLALNNSFNRVGLDHVLLVRIASTAVACRLLSASRSQCINALSHAWIDGGALRTYRHAPNTGSRKSWAAGDATSRAVRLAMIALTGEMGYATALTAPKWGFQDVLFKSQAITLVRPLESYVMENVLFKISFPAEFHAQTAVEAAIQLHPQVVGKLDQIESIEVETQEAGVRIIDKTGPLNNPADRDHCLQYMIAIGLLKGSLTAEDYEDSSAANPDIDRLRSFMRVSENPKFTEGYFDPDQRSIPNAIQVCFKDGSTSDRAEVHFPIGHRRRRKEGIPLLLEKFHHSASAIYTPQKLQELEQALNSSSNLDQLNICWLMDSLAQS